MSYRHGEAYSLMWYSCNCGHRERIWNSRDGVTPFGTTCPSCGQPSLMHTAWGMDERSVEHKLHKGQQFWRDGTPEEAVQIIERRIAIYDVPMNVREKLLQEARNSQGDWRPGWPRLDRQP